MGVVRDFAGLGREDVAAAGGKGANLGELTRAGVPVPPGFVLTTEAYRMFTAANDLAAEVPRLAAEGGARSGERIRALFAAGRVPEPVTAELLAAYTALGEGPVAVRSSATAEDLAEASFAGQQDTYLNVRGADALRDAVLRCWASLWTDRAIAYRAREGIDPAEVALAVVVQRMVEADAAGVLFTANPATGRRDETVISAAWGLGESVVGGEVSTDDLVLAGGVVRSRRTADKQVMTVYPDVGTAGGTGGAAANGTVQRPVPDDRRRAPVLDDAAAVELAGLGARVAAHFGAPQDIEWVRGPDGFAVVQARPITALPPPAADTPTDWTVPDPDGLYFRASIVEQLPDPLTPLFADLVDGSVARSLSALMAEAFGARTLRPGDIGFPTVNGYAYYFYRRSAFRRLLLGAPAAMLRLARGRGRTGVDAWREHAHPTYAAIVRDRSARAVAELSAEELLTGARALLDAGTVYYTAVQSVIPAAATSEMAFRGYYERLVRRAGDPPALTFLLGFDSEPIRAERSLYDLARWTRERPSAAEALRRGGTPDDPGWRARFDAHLAAHGHVVYNLDFASPVPADDPGPVLAALRFFLGDQGGDPYARQRAAVAAREEATRAVLARLDPARRAVFRRLLAKAQRTGPAREDALADIGLGWPALRRMLRELGRRLVADGVLAGPDDVFWLRYDELRAAAVDRTPPEGLSEAIERRRMLWRGRRAATAPQLLPADGWAHRLFGWAMPAGDQAQSGDTITGVAASAGRVDAVARVLDGPADFGRLGPGEVLVARMTTPAWTSLFAVASAVVTDVGGPLSHSSIVAREYGIPAVLGTGVATQRLRDGQRVHVDGDAGTVTPIED